MTLLEKAKATERLRRPTLSVADLEERIDLVQAITSGHITLTQAAKAMGMSPESARSALASSLMSAVTSGLVEVKKTP